MSFNAVLKIDGKEFTILHADYDFTQPTNSARQPTAKTVSGFINVTIEASKDAEPIEWAINHAMVKSGEIIFYKTDAHSELRKIEFENTYCVYYKEIFDTFSNSPMIMMLRLSPEKMTISGQRISVAWTVAASETQSSQAQASPAPAQGVSSFIAD
ncbi:MAG: hypothetical protein E6Q58_00970 [Niabella sp.]|nr:MAG: hypothetical protein E6Q58_00970 [Niabella sp.]